MYLSIIINNINANHHKLFKTLKQYDYNPIVLEFKKINLLLPKYIHDDCLILIFFIITKISENNEIIYKNKKYCIEHYLYEISKLNIKTFIFFDYYSKNKRKKFKMDFSKISLLFGTKEIDENKDSKLLNTVIKYIKKFKMSEELIEAVYNDLKQKIKMITYKSVIQKNFE